MDRGTLSGAAADAVARATARLAALDASSAAEDLEVVARVALNRLEQTGVLQPVRVGRKRDREWTCDALFTDLEALTSPPVGEALNPTFPSSAAPSAIRHRMDPPDLVFSFPQIEEVALGIKAVIASPLSIQALCGQSWAFVGLSKQGAWPMKEEHREFRV